MVVDPWLAQAKNRGVEDDSAHLGVVWAPWCAAGFRSSMDLGTPQLSTLDLMVGEIRGLYWLEVAQHKEILKGFATNFPLVILGCSGVLKSAELCCL